ncbi:MAG TPA: hypothetical protein VGW77_13145 [Candidatus Binatia bacterium]|nr:hypothetical protein [Candidatus Binatia bacterium]
MRDAGLPITLIVVGSAWLLWYFRLFPDIDWIIAVGLVVGGIAVLYLDGMTKNSIVAGPILIATGIAWALYDRWHVTWFVLMPMLLVLLGVLSLSPVERTSRSGERAKHRFPTGTPVLADEDDRKAVCVRPASTV